MSFSGCEFSLRSCSSAEVTMRPPILKPEEPAPRGLEGHELAALRRTDWVGSGPDGRSGELKQGQSSAVVLVTGVLLQHDMNRFWTIWVRPGVLMGRVQNFRPGFGSLSR